MDEERKTWVDFLEGEDTIHLSVDIGDEPRSYSELKERVMINKKGLVETTPLWWKTGRKHEAWRKDLVETEDRSDKDVYRLTVSGQLVYDQLQTIDAVEAPKKVRDYLDVVFKARRTLISRPRSDE